jgi:hypothetical protein
MRTIYRHAYKVRFKAPDWRDRWAYQEYRDRIIEAETWCYEHAKGDWSHREGEPGLFWFDKADDAVLCKMMFS